MFYSKFSRLYLLKKQGDSQYRESMLFGKVQSYQTTIKEIIVYYLLFRMTVTSMQTKGSKQTNNEHQKIGNPLKYHSKP